MFRSGLAILAVLGCVVCEGRAPADPPPLCPYVPTLCPPTECGLIDESVVPYGVNRLGHWVGYTNHCDGPNTQRAIAWTPATGVVELFDPGQTVRSSANGINDRGTIVGIRDGTTSGLYHNDWACIWRNGQFFELPGDEGSWSAAYAVNNSDWVVGMRLSTQPGLSWIGFIWQDGVMVEIDPQPYGRNASQCWAVSDTGWVAGYLGSDTLSTGLAFRWKDGELEALQPLPGALNSLAFGVNSRGLAVGHCAFEDSGPAGIFYKPVVWGPDGVPAMPALPEGYIGGGCWDISDSNVILGFASRLSANGHWTSKAVVWVGGQPHFLSQSIQPVQNASFSGPQAMSANGFIVGTGSYPGTTGGGWLLTPQAPPQDLDGSCSVDGADLAALLAQWGPATSATTADFNLDGRVDGTDLGLLLGAWTAGE